MTAFDRALARLHEHPDLSVSATWRAGGDGAGVAVRVTRSMPDDPADVFGQSIRVPNVTVSVRCADAAAIQPGDTFTFADASVLTALSADRDVEHLTWMVRCRV